MTLQVGVGFAWGLGSQGPTEGPGKRVQGGL